MEGGGGWQERPGGCSRALSGSSSWRSLVPTASFTGLLSPVSSHFALPHTSRADCDWTRGGVVNTGSLNSSPSFRVRCSEWAPFVVGGFYQIADSINPGAAELARKQDTAFRSAQRPG
ncbi:MAG: hypothetical protein ACPIOQ_74800 [Promethearchaeia archaeon]